MGRGAVRPSIRQRAEARARLRNGLDRVQQVQSGPRQPIKPRDNDGVPWLQCFQHARQLWSVAAGTTDFLGVDLLAAGGLQCFLLKRVVLPGG